MGGNKILIILRFWDVFSHFSQRICYLGRRISIISKFQKNPSSTFLKCSEIHLLSRHYYPRICLMRLILEGISLARWDQFSSTVQNLKHNFTSSVFLKAHPSLRTGKKEKEWWWSVWRMDSIFGCFLDKIDICVFFSELATKREIFRLSSIIRSR